MEAYAIGKYIKSSAQKARLGIDTIRRRNVNDALAVPAFTNKRAAKPIEKVLRSAIANASQKAEKENISVDVDRLFVSICHVDTGVTKWRGRVPPRPPRRPPRPMGPCLPRAPSLLPCHRSRLERWCQDKGQRDRRAGEGEA